MLPGKKEREDLDGGEDIHQFSQGPFSRISKEIDILPLDLKSFIVSI